MSFTLDEVSYRVRKIVAAHAGSFPERIGVGTTMDDCRFDSLDHYEMVIAVEDEFHIDIPEADVFGDNTTVEQIITYVAKRTGAA